MASSETEKVEQLEALVNTLREDFDALKTENTYLKLDIQRLQELTTNLHGEKIEEEECNCNLTEIEQNIRQNGITIAKVRHDVVLNGEHTIQNHDDIEETKSEIDDLEATINAVSMDLEATINNVKADLEASIGSVKTDLQQNVADLTALIDQNSKSISDLINVVNTRVIFSAVRTGDNDVHSGQIITFTETKANIGGGMDPDSGVFTTPVAGIYSFSFSARTDDSDPYTNIAVYKNDVYLFRISDYNNSGQNNFGNISYSWVFTLAKNDKIHLKVSKNGLDVYGEDFVWFNGQLLMAQ